jgi:hypothetical protein
MKPTPYDYTSVLASFFDAAHDIAPERLTPLKQLAESTARRALSNPDIVYMPAFKVLDLLGRIVSLSTDIAREPHLRPGESKAMLHQLLLDTSPLLTNFYRDAALERVRYEPVMLTKRFDSALEKRNAILHVRLERMLTIYREANILTQTQLSIVAQQAEAAMHTADFAQYRAGPLCQLFAEMLSAAERAESDDQLLSQLSPNGRVWKSFRLKAHRYSASANDPLISGEPADRIDAPTPTTHHLH